VVKYAQPIRQLLEDEVCGDFEVIHSLNQIHGLDLVEFSRLEKRLRDGLLLSREEARGKVQQVKEWLSESKQRARRRETLSQNPPPGKIMVAQPDWAGGLNQEPTASQVQMATVVAETAPQTTPTLAAPNPPATASGTPPARAPSSNHAVVLSAGPTLNLVADPTRTVPGGEQITHEQAVILEQMVTLFKNGVDNHSLVKAVQDELVVIGSNMNQSEWAMWSLYQTVLLPLLSALGESRAQRYLRRTLSDLRSATPQKLWNTLHPTIDGKQSDDLTATRVPVARMPDNWHF
jgi:ParB family chromosome partitioning protein